MASVSLGLILSNERAIYKCLTSTEPCVSNARPRTMQLLTCKPILYFLSNYSTFGKLTILFKTLSTNN